MSRPASAAWCEDWSVRARGTTGPRCSSAASSACTRSASGTCPASGTPTAPSSTTGTACNSSSYSPSSSTCLYKFSSHVTALIYFSLTSFLFQNK